MEGAWNYCPIAAVFVNGDGGIVASEALDAAGAPGATAVYLDALVEYSRRGESRGQQDALVVAARDATRRANIRYTGGVTTYLEVQDADRQLFDAELGLVRIRRDEPLAVVRLYKALGGGWQEAAPER
jgi:outer membrane protein TolC